MKNQNLAKLEALEVAHRISSLQREKEEAVAGGDFELAAQLLGYETECRAKLRLFSFPDYVVENLQRHADGRKIFRYPVLDMLDTEPAVADERILQKWPASVRSPISLAFEQIPESPSGTLRTLLNVDDIFSMHFEAKLPVLSPEAITRFKPHLLGTVLRGMFTEIRHCAQRGVPAVLTLVAPATFLDSALQSILFHGLKETRCDFVVFQHSPPILDIAEELLPEIALVQVR